MEMEAKRDFGSFHSSNVEELIKQSDSSYKSPSLSVKFNLSNYSKLNLQNLFGTDTIRKELFYLNNEFTFLNHGAFGLSFKPSVEYVNEWKCYAESQPLRFYDREIMPLLVDLIRKFSHNVFKCKPWELCLIENCTYAFNSIINSLKLNKNDQVFIFNTTYGVYKKILRSKCEKSGAVLIECQIEFPIEDDFELLEKTVMQLEKFLDEDAQDKRLKLILVDHIPSNHPFVLPYNELANMVKLKNRSDILFVVDAAHSLGSMNPIILENVDILFTNCHKWFCGPKGTGFMYKNENLTFDLKPAVLSHGIGSGFNSEFIWTGLRDYSAYLGLYANIAIWESCLGGFDKTIKYCTNLARQAAELLQKAWSTDCLVNPKLCSTMICVRLPESFIDKILNQKSSNSNLSYDQAEIIQNFFYHSCKIECPVKCIQSKLYVRISSHVYNNLSDYEKLAKIVLGWINSFNY